jgi:hypothetical protein
LSKLSVPLYLFNLRQPSGKLPGQPECWSIGIPEYWSIGVLLSTTADR